MRGIIEMDLGSHELGQVDPVTRAALERALAGRAIDAAQARELIALPRDRLPLLWCNGALLWAAGIGLDADALAAPDEPGILPRVVA